MPLSLLLLAVLRFQFKAPMWVLLLFTLWIPVYFVAYPAYLKRKWEAFERNFALAFSKGDPRSLLAYYEKQHFLRRFGPRGEMLAKLGLIYSALEKYREAEHVLEQAVDADRSLRRDQLFFNLANVKYELGKYDEAEQIYRSLRKSKAYGRSIQMHLALIDLRNGRRVDESRELLERERTHAPSSLRRHIEAALAS